MMEDFNFVIAIAVATGTLSHNLYFNRGEHHLYGALYVKAHFAAVAALIGLAELGPDQISFSAYDVIKATIAYFCGLYASLMGYRVLFHPLNKFSGPLLARLTSAWLSSQFGKSNAHIQIQRLHEKYGEFVRVGSSDLSIVHPAGVNAVYGSKSKCVKGAWYDLTHPNVSLQTTRDKNLHRIRRQNWSEAFSDKALRGYEERMKGYRAKLMSHICDCADNGRLVDVTKWFNFFTFDVMGDLAFGSSFKMLDTSEQHWALTLLQGGLKPLSFHLPMWLFRVGLEIPLAARDWFRFMTYCNERADERISSKVDVPDIMASLLQARNKEPSADIQRKLLRGDSQLIIVAGSDTTAATLTNMVYELVKQPHYLDLLRDELEPSVQGNNVEFRSIQNLPILNAVIYECLRLHPPVPTVLPRRTPPEGIMVGEVHVPGNMTVWCPQYAIGRNEALYRDATSFIPERWYSKPEMIMDKSAFAPFSVGAYACIGKSLALQNIRNTFSELIMNYDMHTAAMEDVNSFEEKTKDHFTLGLPNLRILFTKRSLS